MLGKDYDRNGVIPATVHMRRSIAAVVSLCLLVAGGLAGIALASWAGHRASHSKKVPIFVARTTSGGEASSADRMGFASMLKPVLPAVVNVSSTRVVKTPAEPFFGDPFFQRFFGDQMPNQEPRERRHEASDRR